MSHTTPVRPLLSVREAAELLGVGTTTAYEWLRRDELPGAVRLGGRWYVRRAVLIAYVNGADALRSVEGAGATKGACGGCA